MDCEEFLGQIEIFLTEQMDIIQWLQWIDHAARCPYCEKELNRQTEERFEPVQRLGGHPIPKQCLNNETLMRLLTDGLAADHRLLASEHMAECESCLSRFYNLETQNPDGTIQI